MRIRGAIEHKSLQNLIGWIAFIDESGEFPEIEILYKGLLLGTVKANQLRPDVRDAGFGDGHCGFAFKMPPIVDGADLSDIELRLRGTEIYLNHKLNTVANHFDWEHGKGSVFVLGPARSGTSVMFLALQKVVGLSGLGESHVPQIFQRLAFQFYEYSQGFSNRAGVLANRLDHQKFRLNLIDILRQFYFDQFNGTPFVDKTPGLEALVGAPFIRQAFPSAKIIIMERNGVETIDSYMHKFNATFDDALKEWSECASVIKRLKREMPDVLFINQSRLERTPGLASRDIVGYLGEEVLLESLTAFFQSSREDVSRAPAQWNQELTVDDVDWSTEERQTYIDALERL